MGTDADARWFEAIARNLETREPDTKRVSLTELWVIFADVFTHRPSSSKRRRLLLESLQYAEQKGVRLPKKAWDRTGTPELPKYVTRVVKLPPAKDLWWKAHYWHPELEWIADLDGLSGEQGRFVARVQRGLVEGWFAQPAPLNRRSVEPTGREKALRKLLKTNLFAEGRLQPELLNITSDVMPLAHELVGARPVALVFENKEPFNVALGVLQRMPNPPYGLLAYGGGGSFEDSVRDFSRICSSERYRARFGSPLSRIEYVGDLDWTGLRIALGARAKAQAYGLPPVVPAAGMHELMLKALHDPRIDHPDGFPDDGLKRARKPDPTATEWLPENTRDEAARILGLGNRVPEEMLTAAALLELWTTQP